MPFAIKLDDVSYLRNGRRILNHIDWQVEDGEHWVILGLNGSGKTTLLNLINGYIHPSAGKATVLGFEFGRASIPDMRTHIGWISSALQQNIPEHDTPLRIVLSGKFASLGLWEAVSDEDRIKAMQVLDQLSIAHLADRRYATLSQGERQKVMIGRALFFDPAILIFDEAFGGLDIIARRQMEELIAELAQDNRTMLFVTHSTDEILPFFQQVLMLKEGSIYAKGRKDALIYKQNLQDFYGQDIDVFMHGQRFYTCIKE